MEKRKSFEEITVRPACSLIHSQISLLSKLALCKVFRLAEGIIYVIFRKYSAEKWGLIACTLGKSQRRLFPLLPPLIAAWAFSPAASIFFHRHFDQYPLDIGPVLLYFIPKI